MLLSSSTSSVVRLAAIAGTVVGIDGPAAMWIAGSVTVMLPLEHYHDVERHVTSPFGLAMCPCVSVARSVASCSLAG
eukprot:3038871-Rhodomonas_salina.1